jgi:hypothetical protein
VLREYLKRRKDDPSDSWFDILDSEAFIDKESLKKITNCGKKDLEIEPFK